MATIESIHVRFPDADAVAEAVESYFADIINRKTLREPFSKRGVWQYDGPGCLVNEAIEGFVPIFGVEPAFTETEFNGKKLEDYLSRKLDCLVFSSFEQTTVGMLYIRICESGKLRRMVGHSDVPELDVNIGEPYPFEEAIYKKNFEGFRLDYIADEVEFDEANPDFAGQCHPDSEEFAEFLNCQSFMSCFESGWRIRSKPRWWPF